MKPTIHPLPTPGSNQVGYRPIMSMSFVVLCGATAGRCPPGGREIREQEACQTVDRRFIHTNQRLVSLDLTNLKYH
ncbi:MAG: hypothetical protein K0M67_05560, partial [Thiobacillus sp.]|nr:hypothetical protein [Thiobacillus sp.]